MTLAKYQACLEKKKVNHSHAREAIYRILLDNINQFMTVASIHKKLELNYPKKVSLNTLYRHLNLFVSCDLVLLIQDDNKKAYYIVVDDEAPIFAICPKCQSVGFAKVTEDQRKVLSEMIQPKKHHKSPFVTLHKVCEKCH